jgi:LmbE family N-acetylglucosaminyl deacetylase
MVEKELVAPDAERLAGPETPDAQRVVAIFAHPDDAEFSCGGTLARWADEGHSITLCIVTNGASGSDDPNMTPERLAETRAREQEASARILGIERVVNLRRQDGTVVPDLDLRRDITRVLREARPDVVITGDPSVYWMGNEYINHPDHRAVAEAALGAVFPAAGNRGYFPELLNEGLEPYKITQVYLASPGQADTWIDISKHIDRKIEALRAHASQMGDWDPNDQIREWNAEDGKQHDPPVEYAEDFRYFKISG